MTKLQKAQAKFRKMELKAARMEDFERHNNLARLDLAKRLRETEATLQEERRKNTLLNIEVSAFRASLKCADEQLVKERARAAQALDVAENASAAAGSIGRMAHSLSDTLQALEVTISKLNKDLKR